MFFVYPSLWEGFGYPIIEAMSLGVAVLTSNTSSMKEIGGNAAMFFSPTVTQDIQNKMNLLIENNDLRKELVKKGEKIAKEYTWKRAYEQIIDSFKKGLS